MKCTKVTGYAAGFEEAELEAVYSDDPEDPNYSYSKATPTGKLTLAITNEGVMGRLKPGRTYDIAITEVPQD